MASADVVIASPSVAAVPKDYAVPAAQEIVPLVVTASLDGSGAASAYLPTLELLSPSGQVVFRSPTSTLVAAGASADVSWFPGLERFFCSSLQTAYQQLVLSNPHVRAYYKLDEGSGTTMFDSGPLLINGTYEAGPTLGVPPLADVTAVSYDDALLQFSETFGVAGVVGTGELSIALWLKTSQNPAGLPFLFNGDDNNFRYCCVFIEAAGRITLRNFTAPANPLLVDLVGNKVVNDGVKHFVVCTLDTAGTQTIYVDGVQDAQAVAALPTLSTRLHQYEFAGRMVGGPPLQRPYNGVLDEIAIYNWPLTAAEIAALYAAGH